MRILISGAAGFICNSLVNSLSRDGHEIMGIVHRRRPIVDGPGVRLLETSDRNFQSAIQGFDPECFVHGANHYSRQGDQSSPSEMTDAIINLGLRILTSLQKPGVHLVNLASFFQRSAGEPRTPNSAYAVVKQCFSDLCDLFAHRYGMRRTELFLFDTYGLEDTRGKLVNQMLVAYQQNKHLELTAEAQEINLLHVSDVVEAVGYVVEGGILGEYAVAAPSNSTIIEIDRLLERLSGIESPITYKGNPIAEVPIPDRVAPRLPGFAPKISLERGIQSLWESASEVI